MNKRKSLYALLALFLLVAACEQYELPTLEEPSAGTADFTKTVVLSDSYGAGFMNGALYVASQNNSFPALLASSLAQTGGGTFNQPSLNAAAVNGCYNPAGGCTQGRLYLKLVNGSPTPVPKAGNVETFAPFAGDKAALNNFSVPGLTIQTAQTGALGGPAVPQNPVYNPYYARFATTPGTTKAIDQAAEALTNNGNFFVLSVGLNDALLYAQGGAANTALLTADATFGAAYNAALGKMLAAKESAKGAVVNIPEVVDLPYFNTVSYNPIPLNATLAAQLNAGFAAYNGLLDQLVAAKATLQIPDAVAAELPGRKFSWAAGSNKIMVTDESLTDIGPWLDLLLQFGQINQPTRDFLVPFQRVRQTRNTDKICLSAGAVIGTPVVVGAQTLVNGVSIPLGFFEAGNTGGSDKYYLNPAEQAQISASVTAFNTAIANAANGASARVALVDAYAAFKSLKAGTVSFKGSSLSGSLAPPFGAFSVDGLHPNARGSGYIANLIITAINSKFSATVPLVDINSLPSNELPVP